MIEIPIVPRQQEIQWRTITVDNRVQLERCHLIVVGGRCKEVREGICTSNNYQLVSNNNINNKDGINNNVNVNNNKAQQRRQCISTNLYKETNPEILTNSNKNKEHNNNVAKRTRHALIVTKEITNNFLETYQKIMRH